MADLNKLKKIALGKYEIVKRCIGQKTLEVGCVNHSLSGLKLQMKQRNWLFGYLHNHCSNATGIDIEKEPIKFLKEKGYDARLGNAESFDLKETFDVIVVSAVTDHLTNFDGLFKSCNKHLKKGGKLLIYEDNVMSIPALIYERLRHGKNLGMHDDITLKILPNTVNYLCGNYGFNMDELKYIPGRGFIRFFSKIIPSFLISRILFYDFFLCTFTKTKDV